MQLLAYVRAPAPPALRPLCRRDAMVAKRPSSSTELIRLGGGHAARMVLAGIVVNVAEPLPRDLDFTGGSNQGQKAYKNTSIKNPATDAICKSSLPHPLHRAL